MGKSGYTLIESTGDGRAQGVFQKVSVTAGTGARVVDAGLLMTGRATGVTVNAAQGDSDNIGEWTQPANSLIVQCDIWCVTAPVIGSGDIGYEVGTTSSGAQIVATITDELVDAGTTVVINSVAQTILVQVTQNANTFAVSAQYTATARTIFCNITNTVNSTTDGSFTFLFKYIDLAFAAA